MNKEYTIKHISDILDIPEETFDDFLVDLKTVYEVSKNHREVMLILGDESSNSEFMPQVIWIDDGKHDTEINLRITEAKR